MIINDEGTIVYHLEVLKDDVDVVSMFFWLVEDNKLYLKCPKLFVEI